MSAVPLHPLRAAGGRVLEAALNRLVALDPDTRSRLAALDGRAVRVDLAPHGPTLRIRVDGTRLRVGPADAGASGLRLQARPSALVALAIARGRDGVLPPGRIDIAGDAELARRLEQVASRYAPDVDAVFTRLFGDVAGFQLARALRRALAALGAAAHATAADAAEYLREESRDLVGRAELGVFLDEVDDLRERAERLAARLGRVRTARGFPA
jgi:ubiquinone biosynthesis protein UbiJ